MKDDRISDFGASSCKNPPEGLSFFCPIGISSPRRRLSEPEADRTKPKQILCVLRASVVNRGNSLFECFYPLVHHLSSLLGAKLAVEESF